MPNSQTNEASSGSASLPLLAAADLQDNLMTASNDLDRLQRLLTDATDSLLAHFHGVNGELSTLMQPDRDNAPLRAALQHMAGAITAMQFQDMASQLIHHTNTRLRNCADRIAQDTMGDDEDGATVVVEAPLRPNPVTQDEMDAGSVELF
jgi:hypothetical protein